MNVKTMEGLVGARTSINLMDTPMRVFDEARSKGDTAAMERAIGYAGDCADKAEEYKTKADKGMEEEAKAAKEKTKSEREQAIQNSREEHEMHEGEIDENGSADVDMVKISEEGKAFLKDSMDLNIGTDEIKTDVVKESITYTKTGEAIHMRQSADPFVNVTL